MRSITLYKFLIIVCIAILFGCGNKTKKASGDLVTNPLSATDTAANVNENLPEMTFVENTHDFGTLVDGEVVSYKFKFKNTGKSDLLISHASASCGCTIPHYPKEPIAPGDESAIDVQFNSSGKVGKVEKEVTIISNAFPNQVYLTITCIVKENEGKN